MSLQRNDMGFSAPGTDLARLGTRVQRTVRPGVGGGASEPRRSSVTSRCAPEP